MAFVFLFILTIGVCTMKTDGLKCACAKFKTPVFIENDDGDEKENRVQNFLATGQCLEMIDKPRRFWVAVLYKGKNAFLQGNEVLAWDCENDLISFTPEIMDAIYNCSDGKRRKSVTGWSYLPSDDTYHDEHDMPLSSLQDFRDGTQQYVSVFIRGNIGNKLRENCSQHLSASDRKHCI
ncbi:uncharacterized protein LOC117344937 isoform X2 [Pecten maximus]|uniref:uncharacterized protein LOC117344937 isoform X2 n=1 Tax=Pecten maximus TaxID=6579 RepID=UPI001458FB96|nr:uncharacterized protein LOC117344937 isoform X2 [Pecten maximus]